jgi:hypothetical protein
MILGSALGTGKAAAGLGDTIWSITKKVGDQPPGANKVSAASYRIGNNLYRDGTEIPNALATCRYY